MKTLITIILLSLTLVSCEIDYSFENPVCCRAELRDSEEITIKYAIVEDYNCTIDHKNYIGEIVEYNFCD